MIRQSVISLLLLATASRLASAAPVEQPELQPERTAELAPVAVSERQEFSLDAFLQRKDQRAAERASGPGTSLAELFLSLEQSGPQIEAARARAEAAQAEALIARGAFDTRLRGDYFGRVSGFFDGQNIDVGATQRLENYGVEFYGGYRISAGSFPIYEDILFTNSRGEIKAGARVSLLRNRETDKSRTDLTNARLTGEAAELDLRAALILLRADAATAYVNWLYRARNVEVFQELLDIALEREKAIRRAIDAGQLADITLEENRQLILSRRSQLIGAQQQLTTAEMTVSIYFRDADGEPLLPTFGPGAALPIFDPYSGRSASDVAQEIIAIRPDLQALRLEIEKISNEVQLARNDRKPTLDFGYEVSRDFGSGSVTREGTDNILQLNFSMPFQLSAARGRERQARAKMTGMKADIRLIEDQVTLALVANDRLLGGARQQIAVGQNDVALARRLQEAEASRYLQGVSNVFQLNVQESQLANAELRLITAQRDLELSLIAFYRMTGLGPLGL